MANFHRKLGTVKKTLSVTEREHRRKLEENLELDKEQSFYKTFENDEIYEKIRDLVKMKIRGEDNSLTEAQKLVSGQSFIWLFENF